MPPGDWRDLVSLQMEAGRFDPLSCNDFAPEGSLLIPGDCVMGEMEVVGVRNVLDTLSFSWLILEPVPVLTLSASGCFLSGAVK